MFARLTPLALLLAGCAPQNAVLTSGEYFAFISPQTSFSLQKGAVDPYLWKDDAWTIDCREFESAEDRRARQLTGIADDCAPDDTSDRCQDRRHKKTCNNWIEATRPGGEIAIRPEHETWLGQGSWWVLHEQLEPWRGEAIITGEDDLQIGFHHRLPGGEDFRFYFAIDPDFAPKQCDLQTGEPVPRDGDWIAEWTDELARTLDPEDPAHAHLAKYVDGGSVFFLNADGFQFNPDDTTDLWFLPEQWEAGTAAGKFSEEAFFSRSPRWGLNEIYEYFESYDASEGYATPPTLGSLYFCELDEGEDARDNGCWNTDEDELNDVILPSIRTDLSSAISPPTASEERFWGAISHGNAWRESDGTKAGFDGWHELHYNTVVFDKSPEQMAKLEPGDSLKGAFTLVMDGIDSSSKWLIRGEFEVPKVKRDKWVTEDIRARKLEENGNTLCVLQ